MNLPSREECEGWDQAKVAFLLYKVSPLEMGEMLVFCRTLNIHQFILRVMYNVNVNAHRQLKC